MRVLAGLMLSLVGCGFQVSAVGDAGTSIDAVDAVDAVDGNGGDAGGDAVPPDTPTYCFGTTKLAIVCLDALPSSDRSFTGTTIFATSAGSTQCATLAAGSSDVCAITGRSISIPVGGRVEAIGTRALVLLATDGAITIAGTLDLSSKKGASVGGAGSEGACSPGTNPNTNGGGQGGSFGTTGGDGGNSHNGTDHGSHGSITDPATLQGGCGGADGAGSSGSRGRGGGGAMLIATTAVNVAATGSINASGAAGKGAPGGRHGGGGGGSGGMLVLDAPVVTNAGAMFANGGGGGGGSGNGNGNGTGGDGADPIATGGAAGGSHGSSAGDGGSGSTAAGLGGTGGDGTGGTDGGGGGGGGAGIIELAQSSLPLGGIVSPPAQ